MNSEASYDLEAYVKRIGYDGALEPTRPVLEALALRHACSIPFENLSVLQGKGIHLELEAIQQKLVTDRKGGYCFEQNSLALGVLQQIGFNARSMAGRVRLDSTRDVLPARTHLFVCVELEGEEWLFDVGVGGFTLTSPIRLVLDIEQETLHERRRIVHEEGRYFHQAWTGTTWVDVYEFTGEEMPFIDREVGNWWTSSSPKSKFSQRLNCAIALPNGERFGILNDRFTHRRGSEVLNQITITSAEHLLEILANQFGMEFPAGTRFGTGPQPWPTD